MSKDMEELREAVARGLYAQRWYEGQVLWADSLLKELFRNYADQILSQKASQYTLKELAELAIKANDPNLRVAVVEKESEKFPYYDNQWNTEKIQTYLTSQKDMLKAGWVKEHKEGNG